MSLRSAPTLFLHEFSSYFRKRNLEENTFEPTELIPMNTTLAERAAKKAATELVSKVGTIKNKIVHQVALLKTTISAGLDFIRT